MELHQHDLIGWEQQTIDIFLTFEIDATLNARWIQSGKPYGNAARIIISMLQRLKILNENGLGFTN